MSPSRPLDGDPWNAPERDDLPHPGVARFTASVSEGFETLPPLIQDPEGFEDEEIVVVPVRPKLSVAIAGFAGLLGLGLILGANTAGPGTRLSYAVVIFGVQLLFILAWTMAMRPPAWRTVAVVGVLTALGADLAAVLPETASLAGLGYVAAGGFVLAIGGQLIRPTDRARVTDALGSTLLIVVGVVAFATLIVLTRRSGGTVAILPCLAATAVALVVARLTDAVFAKPRVAPQVPRGAGGIILGAMLGTLVAAVLGGQLVFPFNPTNGAILGLVSAGVAGLVDLGVDYAEAGREMAGEPPTFWVARHMQGPLGAFALAAPAAYGMAMLFLS